MRPTRKDRLLNGVYQAIGANRIHQRWIVPKRKNDVVYGIADDGVRQGNANGPVTITVSPLGLVAYIVHECLHRAHPEWSEQGVVSATTFLLRRMSDAECKALYDAYAAKVVIMSKPTTEAEKS